MKHAINLFSGLCCLSVASLAHADIVQFSLAMDGAQAAACAGTGSPATGSGTLSLNTDTGVLSFNISYAGLSVAETVAHIHGPAPACVNASPVVTLPLGSPKIGTTILSGAEQSELLAGLYYVNVHSGNFPSGEIRGQILQVPEPVPATLPWSMVVLAVILVIGIVGLARRSSVHRVTG